MGKIKERGLINILCIVMGLLWILANHFGKLPGAIVGSICGSLIAGPIGMVSGCLAGIGAQYGLQSKSREINNFISLILALVIVVLILTAYDKWKNYKNLHGDDKGESDETDTTTEQ